MPVTPAPTSSPPSHYDPDAVAAVLSEAYQLILGKPDNTKWLGLLAQMTGADGAGFYSWLHDDLAHRNVRQVGDDEVLNSGWDPWFLKALLTRTRGKNHSIDELIDFSRDIEQASGNPMPVERHIAVAVDLKPAIIVLSLSRSEGRPAWTDDDRARFARFAPHVRKLIDIHKMMDSYRTVGVVSNSIMNASPGGIILLLPTREVLYTNHTARRILSEGDALAQIDRKLIVKDGHVDAELNEIIARIPSIPDEEIAHRQWFWPLKRNSHERIYQVALQVVRLPEWNIEARESDLMMLLYVNDPKSLEPPTEEQLRKYYDLTAAQARVAIALYGGSGIREAAESLSISINTARSHLRNIYAKTGAASHAELMSILSGTVVRYPAEFVGPIRRHGGPA